MELVGRLPVLALAIVKSCGFTVHLLGVEALAVGKPSDTPNPVPRSGQPVDG
jgi:hypothetical protein